MDKLVMQRLKALMLAGYQIRAQDLNESSNYICLEHPGAWEKVKEKTLFLYDEGRVIGGPRVDDTYLQIEAGDFTAFHRFVANIPKPTWWERNRAPFYTIWGLLGALGMVLVGAVVVDFFWSIFFDR